MTCQCTLSITSIGFRDRMPVVSIPPGQVLVCLKHDGGTYRLLVSDDGIGQASPVQAARGLGQRLVRSMAQQLGGTYDAKASETGRTRMSRFAGPSAAGA